MEDPDDAIYFRGTPHRGVKRFWRGTQRSIPPSETLERIRPFFRRAGVTRVANITHLDWIGIPVTLAIRPNSRSLATSAGKGFSLEAATVSAVMESFELYHTEVMAVPSFLSTYETISGVKIPVNRLPLTRHSIFRVDYPYEWVWAWDLIGQREVAVPNTAWCYDGGGTGYLKNLSCFVTGTNGLASGNTFLEALNAALFEVIERDAVTCAQHVQTKLGKIPPIVDVDQLRFPLVEDLQGRLKEGQVRLTLMDCTAADIGVPVYWAILTDDMSPEIGFYSGYGAHLDPEVAMVRAITEAAQSRCIYFAGSRDDGLRHHLSLVRQQPSQDLQNWRHLLRPTTTRVPHNQATTTFEGDTTLALNKLRQAGFDQAMVVDLSLPDLPIHVVKVSVPGLEGYTHEFYAPGERAKAFLEKRRLQ